MKRPGALNTFFRQIVISGLLLFATMAHAGGALAEEPPIVPPVIGTAAANIVGENAAVWAENVTADPRAAVQRVWAQIQRPGTPLLEGIPLAPMAQVELSFNPGNGRWEGSFPEVNHFGYYDMAFFARDDSPGQTISSAKKLRKERPEGPDPFEDDDTAGTAHAVTVSVETSQRRNFHDAGDADWVSFTAEAGRSYKIRIESPGSSCDPVVRVFGTDGTSVLAGPVNAGGYGQEELVSWSCPADGTYYVAVAQANANDFGSNTGYALRLYPADEGPDAFEQDNSYQSASQITVDAVEAQHHNFHDAADADWVVFYAVSGKSYEIKIENAGANCDAELKLYGPDGTTQLRQSVSGFFGENELISWSCPADGAYFVKVYPYPSAYPGYTPPQNGIGTQYDLKIFVPAAGLPGWLVGRILDALGSPIANALVQSSIGGASTTTYPNGYYILVLPSGSHTLTVSASGYTTATRPGVEVLSENQAYRDVTLSPPPTPGDINGVGGVGLDDAILSLKIGAGLNTSGQTIDMGAEIGGDGKIGLPEAVYVLQKAAGMR